AYVPRFRIRAEEIARVWRGSSDGLLIEEKSVPGPDEDTTTMSIEAARNALKRAQVNPDLIRAVWVGTESKPYAVKPTSTIVAQAIGAVPRTSAADWEFACKAGSEALQAAFGFVGSGMADYAMAIGVDTSQSQPADALEYTTGAGGAAYLIGPKDESLAYLEGSYSYVTDTPDFFRREHQRYPQHSNRFTGKPAYFGHSSAAARHLMEELGYTPRDYAMAVFHQPNTKFPLKLGKQLGFTREQIEPGLLVRRMGNAYAGSSLLGLSALLDTAQPGDRLLLVSFGSGAGSDAFSFVVTEGIEARRDRAPLTQHYLTRRQEIDYATYARFRKKYRLH
ncbi:MAG: hydroxymethylglutaryl-CoA synthase, partial [Anaerolineae bacterium]